jgi:hypothetical protein
VSNSFRTATGRCLIDDETLRIERADRGWLANPRDALTSDEVPPWRKAAVIGVFVAVLTGLGLLVRVAPPWLAGAVVGLLLAAVGWSAYAGRKPEGSITIPLDRVVDVEAHSGIPPGDAPAIRRPLPGGRWGETSLSALSIPYLRLRRLRFGDSPVRPPGDARGREGGDCWRVRHEDVLVLTSSDAPEDVAVASERQATPT